MLLQFIAEQATTEVGKGHWQYGCTIWWIPCIYKALENIFFSTGFIFDYLIFLIHDIFTIHNLHGITIIGMKFGKMARVQLREQSGEMHKTHV